MSCVKPRFTTTRSAARSVRFSGERVGGDLPATGGCRVRPRGRDGSVRAIAAFWVPSTGSVLDLAAANGFTALGGVCFFVGAVLLLPRWGPSSQPDDDQDLVSA
jgi:hypothetical protein